MMDRSCRQICYRSLLLIFTLTLVLGTLGCSRSKPREHFWQFWRSKPAMVKANVSVPDSYRLPPPPPEIDSRTGSSDALSPDRELPPPPSAIDIAAMTEPNPLRQAPAGEVSELKMIYFAFDSDELTPETIAVLENNVAWLLANPSYTIQIEGHCDERGTNEYNMNLGDRRAKTVKAYLVSRGVPADSLHTISYGEERPLDPSQSESAYAVNRRVQFLIY